MANGAKGNPLMWGGLLLLGVGGAYYYFSRSKPAPTLTTSTDISSTGSTPTTTATKVANEGKANKEIGQGTKK